MSTIERLKRLFVNNFDFNIEELKPEATLVQLGVDSLDKIEVMFDIEDEFGIRIPDEEFQASAIKTIQDIVDAVDRFISEQNVESLKPVASS